MEEGIIACGLSDNQRSFDPSFDFFFVHKHSLTVAYDILKISRNE